MIDKELALMHILYDKHSYKKGVCSCGVYDNLKLRHMISRSDNIEALIEQVPYHMPSMKYERAYLLEAYLNLHGIEPLRKIAEQSIKFAQYAIVALLRITRLEEWMIDITLKDEYDKSQYSYCTENILMAGIKNKIPMHKIVKFAVANHHIPDSTLLLRHFSEHISNFKPLLSPSRAKTSRAPLSLIPILWSNYGRGYNMDSMHGYLRRFDMECAPKMIKAGLSSRVVGTRRRLRDILQIRMYLK